jgi:Derlin-2/3
VLLLTALISVSAWLFCLLLLLLFSVRYVGMLEEKFGRDVNGTAAMLTMLSFGIVSIWLLAYTVLPVTYFFGSSLVFMCIYVWSRSDPFAEIVFYGFSFRQWHTPFLFLVMGVLLGGNPLLDLLGIGLGHAYYFLTDMVPRNWGRTVLWTPNFMVDAVKWAAAKWANQPVPVNSAAPRPNWQQGAGHRLG